MTSATLEAPITETTEAQAATTAPNTDAPKAVDKRQILETAKDVLLSIGKKMAPNRWVSQVAIRFPASSKEEAEAIAYALVYANNALTNNPKKQQPYNPSKNPNIGSLHNLIASQKFTYDAEKKQASVIFKTPDRVNAAAISAGYDALTSVQLAFMLKSGVQIKDIYKLRPEQIITKLITEQQLFARCKSNFFEIESTLKDKNLCIAQIQLLSKIARYLELPIKFTCKVGEEEIYHITPDAESEAIVIPKAEKPAEADNTNQQKIAEARKPKPYKLPKTDTLNSLVQQNDAEKNEAGKIILHAINTASHMLDGRDDGTLKAAKYPAEELAAAKQRLNIHRAIGTALLSESNLVNAANAAGLTHKLAHGDRLKDPEQLEKDRAKRCAEFVEFMRHDTTGEAKKQLEAIAEKAPGFPFLLQTLLRPVKEHEKQYLDTVIQDYAVSSGNIDDFLSGKTPRQETNCPIKGEMDYLFSYCIFEEVPDRETPDTMKAFTQRLIEEARAKNNAAGAGR